jgi:nicotinate dehydrogenase subunit B
MLAAETGRPAQGGIELLQRLATLVQWRSQPASKSQSGDVALGRGISYVKYELSRAYVGAVAEVEVDRRSGAIRVRRFFIAHDCGEIINPDGVEAQRSPRGEKKC